MLHDILTILRDFSQPDYKRWLAIMDLRKMEKNNESINILINSLEKDPNVIIRHDAVFMLGKIKSENAIGSVIKALKHDKRFVVRHEAAETLSYVPLTRESKEALEAATNDPVEEVRETAKIALDVHQHSKNVEGQSIFLDYSEPAYKRWNAGFKILNSLLYKRTVSGINSLVQCLEKDPSPVLRHMGAFLLAEVRGKEAEDSLARSALQDKSPLVRHEAAETFAFFPLAKKSKSILQTLLQDDVKEVRDTAKLVLDLHKNSDRPLTV